MRHIPPSYVHIRVASVLADTGTPPWVAAKVADAIESGELPPGWREDFFRIAGGPPVSVPLGWSEE